MPPSWAARVILARELSLEEVHKIRSQACLPVEVFVHGALCVAYSGQCLTSEALGGRSANRGECAQACRMPYEIVCDGQRVDLGKTQYLLSPQDLAAYDLVPRLIELGVHSLKIEGRLKSAEYVANITRHYRQAIDAAWAGQPVAFTPRDVEEMQLSFSRGFSHGFLDGNNHKVLVRGDYAKKRGVFVGRVESITRSGVRLVCETTIKPGDGVVFDGDETGAGLEQGGRVYEVFEQSRGRVELRFGRDAIDLSQVIAGQGVWKTDDPALSARLRRSFEGPPTRLVDVDMAVHAETGEALEIVATTDLGHRAETRCGERLAVARSQPADVSLLRDQLGRLGGTIYRLRRLDATITGQPMIPRSLLNQVRRDLVSRLERAAAMAPGRTLAVEPVLPVLLAPLLQERQRQRHEAAQSSAAGAPELTVLCRRIDQMEAAIGQGIGSIYADFQDIKKYAQAVSVARRGGAAVFLATPRIEKPFEANLFGYLAKQGSDGLLVRNAGGLDHCARRSIPMVADFSLNAANPLSVQLLKERGALRVTASYDLNAAQLFDLIDAVPPDWIELVIHQHIPMFHMEHCVFCAFLSAGTDHTNCGRPCDVHDVKLRDRVGVEHPLKADVGCRNTLFNAVPQTAAEFLPRLIAHGARHLRIEFLDDPAEQVERTIGLYRAALLGQGDPRTLWRELKASNQYGVTRGPLSVL